MKAQAQVPTVIETVNPNIPGASITGFATLINTDINGNDFTSTISAQVNFPGSIYANDINVTCCDTDISGQILTGIIVEADQVILTDQLNQINSSPEAIISNIIADPTISVEEKVNQIRQWRSTGLD